MKRQTWVMVAAFPYTNRKGLYRNVLYPLENVNIAMEVTTFIYIIGKSSANRSCSMVMLVYWIVFPFIALLNHWF